MNLNNDNELKISNENSSIISKFINEIFEKMNTKEQNIFKKYPSDADVIAEYDERNELKEVYDNDICVVSQIFNERVSFIDTNNGKQFDLYYSINDETYNKLLEMGIDENKIVSINEEEFMDIMPGDCFIKEKNKGMQKYYGDLDIDSVNVRSSTDTDVWYYLKDMEELIKNDEGKKYEVVGIENGKIIMQTQGLIGTREIYQKLYSDVQVGDVLIKTGRKYIRSNDNE